MAAAEKKHKFIVPLSSFKSIPMELLQSLRKMPFLRIVIPYLAGLAAGIYGLPHQSVWILTVVLIFLISLMIVIRMSEPISFNRTWIFGALLFLIFFLLGAGNVLFRKAAKEHFTMSTAEMHTGRLVVIDNPEIREESVRVVTRILHLDSLSQRNWLCTKAIIIFPLDARSIAITPGNVIIVRARFNPVPGPANPGEFDYSNYLACRDIDYQAWVYKNGWKVVEKNKRNLKILALQSRDRLLYRFRVSGMSHRTTAVLSALTLGYKTDLEEETTALFTRAGVVHIMALSGFNVGLIFLMVNFCLGLFPKSKTFGFLRLLIALTAIWSFALITGLSASVTRASVMISLFLTGRFINRKVHPLNSISASAFLSLVISPFSFTDVGFQLSYLAVLGLIYIQPRLYRLITLKYWLPDKVWMLFTVSVAAQLATVPLTLYYFHQFPLFFWITNLYVVPMVSLIIYTSVPFFVLYWIGPVRAILARMLEFMTHALLLPLEKLEEFPGVLMEGIFISRFQVLLLFIMLVTAIRFLVQRRPAHGLVTLTVLLVFLVANGFRLHAINRQQYLTVNSIRGTSVLNIISGRNSRIWCFSDQPVQEKVLQYTFENWWIKHGVCWNTVCLMNRFIPAGINIPFSVQRDIIGDNVFICMSGLRLVICTDDVFTRCRSQSKIDVDYVVVTNHIKPAIKKLLGHFNIGTVIIDSSVGFYESGEWSTLCNQNGVNCWPVREKGAFVVELGGRKKEVTSKR